MLLQSNKFASPKGGDSLINQRFRLREVVALLLSDSLVEDTLSGGLYRSLVDDLQAGFEPLFLLGRGRNAHVLRLAYVGSSPSSRKSPVRSSVEAQKFTTGFDQPLMTAKSCVSVS